MRLSSLTAKLSPGGPTGVRKMARLTLAMPLALALMAVQSTACLGAVVEIVLVPCHPGVDPKDCGLKAKLVEGSAEISTPNGNFNLSDPNTVFSIDGRGNASTQ